jgi:gamma-glutamyltranspeptidase
MEVVSSQPLATQIGLDILYYAAIAVNAALGLMETTVELVETSCDCMGC